MEAYEFLELFYKFRYYGRENISSEEVIEIDELNSTLDILREFSAEKEIYCPKCGGMRRHELKLKFDDYKDTGFFSDTSHNAALGKCAERAEKSLKFGYIKQIVFENMIKDKAAILIEGRCLQCDNKVIILIYQQDGNASVVKLFEGNRGVYTEHTPKSISYYLNEASKCKSVAAYTPAVAMYRTALENLLYDQGYKSGMLNDKIKSFEKDKEDGKAKRWADVIDEEILYKIKELGNWAVHPNKGDISKQQYLQDERLIDCLDEIFTFMLDEIYEKEHTRNSLLDILRRKKQDLVN